jgi:hypothetical protein
MICARLPGPFARLHRRRFSTSSLSRLLESALAETDDIATVSQLLKVVREFLLIFFQGFSNLILCKVNALILPITSTSHRLYHTLLF